MKASGKLVLPFTLAIAACGGGSSEGEGGKGSIDEAAGDDSWVVKNEIDPMTDAKVASATATLEADGYSVETELACINETKARFKFTFYGALGIEAPLQSRIIKRPFGLSPAEAVTWATRVDDEPPMVLTSINFRGNQLVIEAEKPSAFARSLNSNKIVTANKLLFRFPMTDGQPTIMIDMTNPKIQGVMAPCANKMRAVFAKPIEYNDPMEELRERQAKSLQQMDDEEAKRAAAEEGARAAQGDSATHYTEEGVNEDGVAYKAGDPLPE